MTAPEQYRPEPSGRFADTVVDPAQSPQGDAGPCPEPKASPLARGWTVILGVALLAAAGVAIRDVLIVNDSVTGTQLLPPVFDWVSSLPGTAQDAPWTLWAGIGCALAALFFLAVTIRPRRRTHLAFGNGSGLHGRPVDVARLSTAAARRVPGVLSARTVATRRRLTVHVVTAVSPDSTETIKARVAVEVGELAELLNSSPDIDVTVATQREDR